MIPTAGDSLGLDRKTSLGLSTVNEGVYQRHKQYSNQQMLDVIKQTQVTEQVPKDQSYVTESKRQYQSFDRAKELKHAQELINQSEISSTRRMIETYNQQNIRRAMNAIMQGK